MIEPSLTLDGEAFDRAVAALDTLIASAHARYALLVDRRGFVLAHREAIWAPQPPALDAIGTLVASNAAATSALAGMLGENSFRELVHQGSGVGLFIEAVNEDALLAVVFDESAPLGLVRLHSRRTVEEVAPLFTAPAPSRAEPLSGDFAASAQSKLDDLFGAGEGQ
ncbi:MAG TPA: roadblock/LC7 domain-containing protein [Deinococcales bacterium]|nr:roadblock/LC7 domain-containing protein [Deinococcales bacterium]